MLATSSLCGIYVIENLINHKKYVGQAVNIKRRWNEHKNELNKNKHSNQHLQMAWNKYGEDNFEFNIIEICNKEDLNMREIYWIDKLKTFKPKGEYGYNLTAGGDERSGENNPMFGKYHSEETKLKISKNHADLSKENHPMYGKHLSEETKLKISKANSGENSPYFGKPKSEEFKQHLSELYKGKYIGEKHHGFGKPRSEETKNKISEKLQGRQLSEEHKQKLSKARLASKRENASSQYYGVCWNKKSKKWKAQIRFNGKTIYLGYYNTELDAALAYDNKSIELYKEDAILNFPDVIQNVV